MKSFPTIPADLHDFLFGPPELRRAIAGIGWPADKMRDALGLLVPSMEQIAASGVLRLHDQIMLAGTFPGDKAIRALGAEQMQLRSAHLWVANPS
jgi:hypothetical protein